MTSTVEWVHESSPAKKNIEGLDDIGANRN